jgi:hypothetical protein
MPPPAEAFKIDNLLLTIDDLIGRPAAGEVLLRARRPRSQRAGGKPTVRFFRPFGALGGGSPCCPANELSSLRDYSGKRAGRDDNSG